MTPQNMYFFWADNCAAQNKNWTLFTSCVIFVNENWGPDTVTFKYFESGHSFMKADAIHGAIGKQWNKAQEVLDFQDLLTLVKKSCRTNKIIELHPEDFVTFENGCQPRKQGTNAIPLLNNVKICQFRKGSRSLFFKSEIDALKFKEVKFLKPKFKHILPEVKQASACRGVNQEKKEKIIKELVNKMPPKKQLFWRQLPVSTSSEDLGKLVGEVESEQ